MVHSIFIIITIGTKKTHVLLCIRDVNTSLNVWAGIVDKFLIGPFFLDGRLTQSTSIFLSTRLLEILEGVLVDVGLGMRFVHDGAPPRFSRVAGQFLNQHFANKCIGRGGSVAWPARSPDFNPLDFHLWGHLKSISYTQRGLKMLKYYEIE